MKISVSFRAFPQGRVEVTITVTDRQDFPTLNIFESNKTVQEYGYDFRNRISATHVKFFENIKDAEEYESKEIDAIFNLVQDYRDFIVPEERHYEF